MVVYMFVMFWHTRTMFSSLVLAALATAYVETIASGKVPCIESAVLSMAAIENSRAVEEGLEAYRQIMEQTVVMPTPDDKTLTDAHIGALKEAVKLFLEKAVFDSNHEYQETMNVSVIVWFSI